MRFVVLAYDGDDPDVVARRAETRPRHLEGMQPLVEDGRLLLAGAILGEGGKPVGSVLLFDVEDREAVDDIVMRDPYRGAGVWQRFEIWPFTPAMGAWLPAS
jgi:uncharacterized protein YciI